MNWYQNLVKRSFAEHKVVIKSARVGFFGWKKLYYPACECGWFAGFGFRAEVIAHDVAFDHFLHEMRTYSRICEKVG